MSHTPRRHKYDDNECSGPRPPVPGEECRFRKMTEGVSECSRNSPSYLYWAEDLSYLLDDPDGVELLKKYVEDEDPRHNDHLKFYFACEGLKRQSDLEKVGQIITVIYRFLRKRKQLPFPDDLRRTIREGLSHEAPLSPNIFDSMQQNVLQKTIKEKVYPAFLCSETYIQYIQQMSGTQERISGTVSGGGSSSGASGSSIGGGNGTGAVGGGGASGLTSLPCTASGTSGIVPGTCSAGGSIYGPSTSASSSGSISATGTLPRSSTLPTLHEDSPLVLGDDFQKASDSAGQPFPLRLTDEMLRATQTRRLEVRPPGAHGYVLNPINTINTSYMPNTRAGSVSSGTWTDSETYMDINELRDGRPYVQRKPSSSETKAIRQSATTNKELEEFIPRTKRINPIVCEPVNPAALFALLVPKLEELKNKQDREMWSKKAARERRAQMPSITDRVATPRALCETLRFHIDEDNDQDILDQHVSRVWNDQTPHRSPGTMSPCPPLPSRRRTLTQDSGMLLNDTGSSIGGHSMRHSKSMPEHSSSSRTLTNRPRLNTDIYSNEGSHSGSNIVPQIVEEAKRRLEDEIRLSRRYSQQHPLPSSSSSMMMQPGQSMSSSSSGSSSMNQLQQLQQPPPLPAKPQIAIETVVVFTYLDEELPYRVKILSNQPTLGSFKAFLPKKGNYRYFFRAHCEDPASPVVQEEVVNDSDILPLFEGKVMGIVKLSE